jgi:hypothetical protein
MIITPCLIQGNPLQVLLIEAGVSITFGFANCHAGIAASGNISVLQMTMAIRMK